MSIVLRLLIFIGAATIAASSLFPPFVGVKYDRGDNVHRFIGHHFVASQPEPYVIAEALQLRRQSIRSLLTEGPPEYEPVSRENFGDPNDYSARIDFERWIVVQFGILALVGGIFLSIRPAMSRVQKPGCQPGDF